jgi:hypothetical protein
MKSVEPVNLNFAMPDGSELQLHAMQPEDRKE